MASGDYGDYSNDWYDPNRQNATGAAITGTPYSATLPQDNSPESLKNLNDALGFGAGGNGVPQPAPGTKQSLQDVYSAYRAANPNPGQNFNGLQDAFRAAGYNATPFMYGNTPSGNELFIDGQKYKMTVGDVGQNGASWYDWGSNDSAPGGDGGGSFSAGLSTMPTGPKADYAQNEGKLNSVWQQLMDRATQGETIDTRSPAFRQTADRYAAGVERSRRNAIADNAEKMSAQMLGGSGAQAVANRGINEQAGQAAGNFEANLAQRELANKRQQISEALQLMGNLGNSEQQRKLTQELAQLDSQMRLLGINSGERIANNNLGFNYSNLEANQNNVAANAILNGR